MLVLPIALLALPVWWREKTSWQPYHLSVKSWARSIAFSPDSKYVAVGESGWVNVWDVQSHNLVKAINTGDLVQTVAFSSNSQVLACGMARDSVTLWDWRNGRVLQNIPISNKQNPGAQTVDALAFVPDGQTLAVGLSDGSFDLVNFQIFKIRNPLPGHPQNYKRGVALSPDGKTFAREENTGITLYDTRTIKAKGVLSGAASAIAFSADGARVAGIGQGESVTVWDAKSGAVLHSWPIKVVYGIPLVALSPDGAKVSDGYHLWDVATGKLEKEFPGSRDEGLAFSPDGATLATGSSNRAELWRLK